MASLNVTRCSHPSCREKDTFSVGEDPWQTMQTAQFTGMYQESLQTSLDDLETERTIFTWKETRLAPLYLAALVSTINIKTDFGQA